jgi:hypothetical protein
MPYMICDVDGTPVTPAQAKAIIAGRSSSQPTRECSDARGSR